MELEQEAVSVTRKALDNHLLNCDEATTSLVYLSPPSLGHVASGSHSFPKVPHVFFFSLFFLNLNNDN